MRGGFLLVCSSVAVCVVGCGGGRKPPRLVCQGQVCKLACTTDAECDDRDVCDGHETCDLVSGQCQPGTPLGCDDGDPCNGTEVCNSVYGCQPGTPVNCDDGNPCTADGCDAMGNCQHTSLEDGVGCTNGAGIDGICQGGECDVGCTTDTQCDNKNACDGIETCDTATGKCQPGVSLTCDNGDVCDGKETCNAMTGCQPGTPLDCDDGESCTVDSCDSTAGCQHDAVADGTICQNGAGDNGSCQTGVCVVECVTDADCDDSDVCDGAETCDTNNGTCQQGTPLSCDDGNDCTSDTCDATAGCQYSNVNDGTTCTTSGGKNGTCSGGTCLQTCVVDSDCNDNVSCTNDTCDLGTHTCSFQPISSQCNDNNDCTADACDPTSGCTHTPVADGTSCFRRYFESGRCMSGTCQ